MDTGLDDLGRDQMMSALFANMVLQQTNMALMFLGKVPHPETGETVKDLEAARMFIDQLEMLETKTKGNLTKQEEGLLKESLMTLRLAFVQAVEKGEPAPASGKRAVPVAEAAEAGATGKSEDAPEGKPASGDDESKKKFVKKY
jgi:uncharacterized protein DUF1844